MNDADNRWQRTGMQSAVPLPTEGELDLSGLLHALWRSKLILTLFAALGVVVAGLYLSNATSLYTASGQLIVETQQQQVVDLESVVSGVSSEDSELNSQIEIIKSRKVLGGVVDKLGLEEDPEFVAELRDPSVLTQIRRSIKAQINQYLPDVTPESPEPRRQTRRDSAIDALAEMLAVSIKPKTFVFRISIETNDPQKSVDIVNTVAETFIANQTDKKVDSTRRAAIWLEGQVAELGVALENAERAVADYRRNNERIITETEVAASIQNLNNARGRLNSQMLQYGEEGPRNDRERALIADLNETVVELEAIAEGQYEDLLALTQLEREAEAAAKIYEYFVQRLNEIQVQTGIHESNIQILSEAIPRYIRTYPRATMALLTGLLLGTLLGAAFVIARKLMDRTFTDAAELQSAFGIPVFGTIPKAPTTNRSRLLAHAIDKPASLLMEAIRSLRTSLMHSALRGDSKVLLTTSSIPQEAKTTGAILLALTSAAINKRVLLVECDLRRSVFEQYFKRRSARGLYSAIEHPEAIDDIVTIDPKTGVHVIFGEKTQYNAADIFATAQFGEFLSTMREFYDLIILDAPPILPVPDALLIAEKSDAVVYSVKAGSTTASTVKAGLRLFENNGIRIDGLCLTQIERGMSYGSYQYQYKSYGR